MKFKVGDPVRLTTPSKCSGIVLERREEGPSKANCYKVKFKEGGKGEWWIEHFLEYDFKEDDKLLQREDTLKFKVGDRVKVTRAVGGDEKKNVCGKIINIDNVDGVPYLVEFDENIDGHDGRGDGKKDHCWWCAEKDMQRLKEFKKGDRVVVTSEVLMNTTIRVGQKGTVLADFPTDYNDNLVSVEFDDDINGHSCLGMGRERHCWNCNMESLALDKEKEVPVSAIEAEVERELKFHNEDATKKVLVNMLNHYTGRVKAAFTKEVFSEEVSKKQFQERFDNLRVYLDVMERVAKRNNLFK